MEFPVQTGNPVKIETACIVVPVFKDGDLLPSAAKLDDASERLIGQLIERGDFDAKLGNVQLIPFAPGVGAERLLLVGLGNRDKCREGAFRKALDAAFTALAGLPVDDAAVAFTDVPLPDRACDWRARMVAEAAQRAVYRFTDGDPAPGGSGRTFGADLRLTTSRFLGGSRNLDVTGYVARSLNAGVSDNNWSPKEWNSPCCAGGSRLGPIRSKSKEMSNNASSSWPAVIRPRAAATGHCNC